MSGLTWLGHSTVVIDLEGTRVVTDPVLRARVWHLRRERLAAADALDDLDAILLSHTLEKLIVLRPFAHAPMITDRRTGELNGASLASLRSKAFALDLDNPAVMGG